MTSTAGQNKNNILSSIITKLKEVANFSNRVYKAYDVKNSAFPYCLVHLSTDDYLEESTSEDQHNISLVIMIKDTRNVRSIIAAKESELEDFIELVGLVEDKIKANKYNPGIWENIRDIRVNYTWGQDRTFTYYNARIDLIVRAQW